MNDKRYTVFVSSTFRDLVEERQAALRAILALGHFPTGMEVFPAAGDTPWKMISRVIADADYYVLVIAGRYGSTTTEGISYTEREYEEALTLKKSILAFLHESPDKLSADKVEMSLKPRRQLERFRKRVEKTHHCKFWKDSNELALQITQGLLNAFNDSPSAGWVRSGGPDVVELLSELNNLRQKHEILREENLELREQLKTTPHIRIKDFNPEEPLSLLFNFGGYKEEEQKVVFTWGRVFVGFGAALLEGASPNDLRNTLAKQIIAEPSIRDRCPDKVANAEKYTHSLESVKLTADCLKSILLGLMARGLVTNRKEWRTYTETPGKTRSVDITMWYLTPEGQRLYLMQGAG